MPEGRLQMSDNTTDEVRGLQGKAPYSAIAREALKVIAALQAQLDAKDTEIARLKEDKRKMMSLYDGMSERATDYAAQIAERDATIARFRDDHKSMWMALTEILGNSDDEGAIDCAMDCLQSLKEPNT